MPQTSRRPAPSSKGSREDIESTPDTLLKATELASDHVNLTSRNYLAQPDGDRLVIETEPQNPMKTAELDALYDLPFTRREHFTYTEPVPALETVRFSITTHAGRASAGRAFGVANSVDIDAVVVTRVVQLAAV